MFGFDNDRFDNSDFSKNSKFYVISNKKVIGKFKDESLISPIIEFVGLRAKMYSYTKDNETEHKTAKSVKKYVIEKQTKHENYKDVLTNNKQLLYNMKTIRSQNH